MASAVEPSVAMSTSTATLAFGSEPSALVTAVRAGEETAKAALYRRYAPEVARVLGAIMGFDSELGDLLQETFIEAFSSIGSLKKHESVGPWLRQIAVHRARHCIRRRKRMRLLFELGLVEYVEPEAPTPSPEVREALAETYRVLDSLSLDLRVAFTLRHIEGLELTEVASACSVSLATIKRRLGDAETKFRRLAERNAKLEAWVPWRSA